MDDQTIQSPSEDYIVGTKKPWIIHVFDEGLSYLTEQEAKLDDGDFIRIDNGF